MSKLRDVSRNTRDPMAGMNRDERRAYLKRARYVSFTFKLPRTAVERLKVIPGATDEERIGVAVDAAIKQFERLRAMERGEPDPHTRAERPGLRNIVADHVAGIETPMVIGAKLFAAKHGITVQQAIHLVGADGEPRADALEGVANIKRTDAMDAEVGRAIVDGRFEHERIESSSSHPDAFKAPDDVLNFEVGPTQTLNERGELVPLTPEIEAERAAAAANEPKLTITEVDREAGTITLEGEKR